jgi:hypothetical protein
MKALDAIRIALKFSDMGMTHLSSEHNGLFVPRLRFRASSGP